MCLTLSSRGRYSWERVHDDEGRLYYANFETGQSSWEPPRAPRTGAQSAWESGAHGSSERASSGDPKVPAFLVEIVDFLTCAKARKGSKNKRR